MSHCEHPILDDAEFPVRNCKTVNRLLSYLGVTQWCVECACRFSLEKALLAEPESAVVLHRDVARSTANGQFRQCGDAGHRLFIRSAAGADGEEVLHWHKQTHGSIVMSATLAYPRDSRIARDSDRLLDTLDLMADYVIDWFQGAQAPPRGGMDNVALDALSVACFTVIASGKAIPANIAAYELCLAKTPSALSSDLKRKPRPFVLRQIDVLLSQHTENNGVDGAGPVILGAIRTEDGEARLAYVWSAFEGAGLARSFVFVSGPKMKVDAAALRHAFNLTKSEARLAEQIACGNSIQEAAVAMGITEASARTYTKKIFSKLGVSRQAELVALVSQYQVPIVEHQPAATITVPARAPEASSS